MNAREVMPLNRRNLPLIFSILLPIFLLALSAQASVGPVITAINDSNPPLSGRVAISGTGFGIEGEVYIAGHRALTSTWTDTRIVAYVPENVPVGPTTLYVVGQGQQSNEIALIVKARQAEGRVRWTFEAEGNNLWWRPALAPDGTIFLHSNNATDGLIYALSPSGALLWIQKVNWYPYVPPSAGPDGAVYVGSISRIYRISPQGEIDWVYTDAGPGPRVAPTIGPDGLLYGAFDGGIGAFAMEPLTGQLVWSDTGTPRMTDKAGEAIEMKFGPSSPGQSADQLYISMDGGAGFYAFSLDGDQRFTTSLGNVKGTAEAAIGLDGTIYGPRYLGLNVAAVDPDSGSTLWEYDPPDWAVGTNNVEIGPDNMLYFTGSSAKLEAFDPSSQSRRWQVFEPEMLLERPSISPDGSVLVVHGTYGNGQPGFVKGFNPTNGRELWTVNLDGAPYPEPRSLGVHHSRITPDSSTAYMSTMTLAQSTADPHATLYAIDISSGPIDGEAPVVSIAIPINGDQVSGNVQIVVDASDDRGLNYIDLSYSSDTGQGQVCAASPDGARNYTLNCNWDTQNLPLGTYSLLAYASDAAGNNATDTISVEVVDTVAPALRSSAIDMSAKVRQGTVNVSAKVYVVDQDGSAVRSAVVTISWQLPNGTTFNQTTSSDRKGVARFDTSGGKGTYTVTVTNIARSGYDFDAANSVLSNSITK